MNTFGLILIVESIRSSAVSFFVFFLFMSSIKRREVVTAAAQIRALDLLLRGISSHLKDISRRSTIVHRRATDGERRNTLNDPELGDYGFLVLTPPPYALYPLPPLGAEQLLDTRHHRGK